MITEQLNKLAETLRQMKNVNQSQSAFSAMPKKMNFSDYLLTDGTTIRIDGEMAVGSSVYVVDGDNIIPAPDGSHEIPNTAIIKTENGFITEIQLIEAKPDVTQQDIPVAANDDMPGMEPEMEPQVDPMVAKMDTITEKLNAIYDLLAKMTGEFENESSKNAGKFSAIEDSISKLAQMPTAGAMKINKNALAENAIEAKKQKFEQLTQVIKNLK
jgi:hypothetical protein